MKTWAIIGLGWLGEALAQRLELEGHTSWGTHRSSFDVTKDDLPLIAQDVLFLNTPPIQSLAPEMFANKMSESKAQRIIFISSTSVFGGHQGPVDETSSPMPDTQAGHWLHETELSLRRLLGSRLLIIRPGGLIGGARHPARHLSGRTNIPGGQDRVNLIHRTDLISLILATPHEIPLLHAVSSHHPTRAEYYGKWCEKLQIPLPDFLESETSKKVVNSRYAEKLISWQCQQLDWL